jgi:hypothetical protein
MKSTTTHTPPNQIEWLGYDISHFNFNIVKTVIEGEDGSETYDAYEYDQLILSNPLTKEKIEQAMLENGFDPIDLENIDIAEAPFPPTILEANKVPAIISTLQGKLQLLKLGLIDTIEAIIKQSGQAENIYWKDSSTWERSSPILNRLAPVIGMSQEGLDQFFIDASKLK